MKAGSVLVCILGVVLSWGLFSSAHAQVTQEWVARYNGPGYSFDIAHSMAVDRNGNVYVTGWSDGLIIDHYQDYATVKYNADGQQQWVALYNGTGDSTDYANSIAVDGHGNVYVTGFSWSSDSCSHYVTIKYNIYRQQQWIARSNWPGSSSSLAVDGHGNVYVTGGGIGSGIYVDFLTIKYDSVGQQQWVAIYNGPANDDDWATCLAIDGDGNVYVTGSSGGNGTSYDYATIKYNANGRQQWVVRYNGPGFDYVYSLVLDGSSDVYVTGQSWGSGTGYDYATVKYSADGQQLWVARYNGPGDNDDSGNSLAVDSDDNVYVTGWSTGSGTGADYATIKYNSTGQQQWVARYNEPGNGIDCATCLALDGNGNVYVTGYSWGETGYDYATIKYDAAGAQQWVMRYDGGIYGEDDATSLAVDGNGNVYVTGYSMGSGTVYDYATIKYSQNEAVDPWAAEVPLEFALKGAAPNPFNPSTVLSYELRVPSQVNLVVYDTAGRLIATLVNERQQAGEHSATFVGSGLASGIYLVRFDAGEFTATQKLVLLK